VVWGKIGVRRVCRYGEYDGGEGSDLVRVGLCWVSSGTEEQREEVFVRYLSGLVDTGTHERGAYLSVSSSSVVVEKG
jgi:hypothetical protein